jgi:hypothetical protein
MNRDTQALLQAVSVFERQGCKRSSLIDHLQRDHSHVTVWLLAARLCQLWHDDWGTWIQTEGPLPEGSAPYFEGEASDEAVLWTWLSVAEKRIESMAELCLLTGISQPLTPKSVPIRAAYRPVRRQRIKHWGGVNA